MRELSSAQRRCTQLYANGVARRYTDDASRRGSKNIIKLFFLCCVKYVPIYSKLNAYVSPR